ncbi:hypothetical protein FJT64_001878 [Amphibalanus amphitrite]|uniref:Uncharacterized protein n=1 Tax=Amphibalanus amphitrite TaxID=1232801 RepID=A0A6A4X3L2_AMPAM|nr:hypothetical protein FJT64_001878 [Amphibalanus amphitrite]
MVFNSLAANKSHLRTAVIIFVAACILLIVLITTGVVTSPFKARGRVWLFRSESSRSAVDELPEEESTCDCVWRIGCPKFRWQTNFTSPIYRCGYEVMTESLVSQCLRAREASRGRAFKLHIAGHVREAFLADYLRGRLIATTDKEGCQLVKAPATPKNFDSDQVPYYTVKLPKGSDFCEMSYSRQGMTMDYRFIGQMGEDVFSYVNHLTADCAEHGCEGDILIMSGGIGELLNSTLLDSFTGVRKFQRGYERLLPMLIGLVQNYRMEVVWKIHEPVTDELIPENSMVRNDLLQEYNALIMEQTMMTPVQVWTSHMLMKLHHIEDCDRRSNSTTINEDSWRCEEEFVAGDRCHDEYFDTIFNKVCDKAIAMPENPCCSA